LTSRQDANGDWPHESIVGVFNANCMITYMNYRNAFPLKALGRYVALYGSRKD
jgi:squalene cyclase